MSPVLTNHRGLLVLVGFSMLACGGGSTGSCDDTCEIACDRGVECEFFPNTSEDYAQCFNSCLADNEETSGRRCKLAADIFEDATCGEIVDILTTPSD